MGKANIPCARRKKCSNREKYREQMQQRRVRKINCEIDFVGAVLIALAKEAANVA